MSVIVGPTVLNIIVLTAWQFKGKFVQSTVKRLKFTVTKEIDIHSVHNHPQIRQYRRSLLHAVVTFPNYFVGMNRGIDFHCNGRRYRLVTHKD